MKFSMRDSQHRWAKEKAKQTQSGAFFNKLKSYSVKLVKPKVCMNLYVCRQQTSLAALSTLQGPLVDPRPSWYHRFFPDFLDILSHQIWIFFYQIWISLRCSALSDQISVSGQYHLDSKGSTRDLWLELGYRGGNANIFLAPKKFRHLLRTYCKNILDPKKNSDIFLPSPKLFSHSGSDLLAPQPRGCTGFFFTFEQFSLLSKAKKTWRGQ